MYRQKVSANEFRNFYLTSAASRSGHDIVEQNSDLGAKAPRTHGRRRNRRAGTLVRLARTSGLRGGRRNPDGEGRERLAHEAVKAHPDRFAAFAALATADPAPRPTSSGLRHQARFQGRDDPRPHPREFLDEKNTGSSSSALKRSTCALSAPTLPHPDAVKAYFHGYEDLAERAGVSRWIRAAISCGSSRRSVRRLPAPQDHPRASGRRIAFRDAPGWQRSHLARGSAKEVSRKPRCSIEGQSARHHQRNW